MLTSYKETLAYLYDNLPMFQRIGAAAFTKDLSNTLKLCQALGNPQLKLKCVHIAGTNGKGSTSHMIASIFQSAGYKTGLYTSPHLKEFTERIRINGEEIYADDVVDFVNRIEPIIAAVKPSFFEITVAMAFDYFVSQKVDIAIIEVGLGGRLDSTNIIRPELALITNIGWDHTDILGDSLEKIAYEKAGIIKSNVPVVISERQDNIASVFTSVAQLAQAPIHFGSDEYRVNYVDKTLPGVFDVYKNSQMIFSNLELPLQGFYQQKNLCGVLKAIDILRGQGWKINDDQVSDGLANVVKQTKIKGRWHKLQENPLVVCDTAHNVDGVREIILQINAQSYKKLHVVWGSVKDKDVGEMLRMLPVDATYYFCQAQIPRALDAHILHQQAIAHGLSGTVVHDVNKALAEAKKAAQNDDMIFIGGSTFVVAELETL